MDSALAQQRRHYIQQRLADEIGVLGEIIVHDTLRECGLQDLHSTDDLTSFLRQLRRELPSVINGARVINDLYRHLMLNPWEGQA